MTKIIFDDSVILSQGKNLLDQVVPQQCVCINWEVDGYHQSRVGVPDNYEVWADANGDIHVGKKKYFTGIIVVTPYIIREQASGANKKVTEDNLASTLIVDDGKICGGAKRIMESYKCEVWASNR